MTFITDTPTLRAMMNESGQDSHDTERGVCKCKGELWNMLMSSNRYIRMSLVLQKISYGI